MIRYNRPQSEIDKQKSIINYWQGQYDYKKNKLFDYLSADEEKRIISHFNSRLEEFIRNNDLMRYNTPLNILQDVYKLILSQTQTLMIPDNLNNVDDLEEYNIIQTNNAQDKLTLDYVRKHFDKVTQ